MEYADFDYKVFEQLEPWRIVQFSVPNTLNVQSIFEKPKLKISVIDSPITPHPADTPLVGVLLVRNSLAGDWNFSTDDGLTWLVSHYHNLSRLIVIANDEVEYTDKIIKSFSHDTPKDMQDEATVKAMLASFLKKLLPAKCTDQGIQKHNFLTYEDDLISAVSIYTSSCDSHVVQGIDIQDVEVRVAGDPRNHFRRRMRYKTMPNVIQCESKLVAKLKNGNGEVLDMNANMSLRKAKELGNVVFVVDQSTLVQQQSQAIVTGLSMVASIKKPRDAMKKPVALCIGVGRGALLNFLKNELGFVVVGVQYQEDVISAAKSFFELEEENNRDLFLLDFDPKDVLQLLVEPEKADETPTKLSEMCGLLPEQYDVVVVDLNYPDKKRGRGVCAPPRKYITKDMIGNIKKVLSQGGALIMHVIVPDVVFHMELIEILKNNFNKLYKIEVGKETEFVLIATTSPSPDDMETGPSVESDDNDLLDKIKLHATKLYLSSIVEI